MSLTRFHTAGGQQSLTAWIVLIGMVAVIGSALAFQYIGGYVPCALCLEQRDPYYIAIPVLAAGAISALLGGPALLIRAALAIAFVCLLATAALGFYHAGVEYGWWPGPEACSAGMSGAIGNSGSLLESLAASKPPSCNEAAGRFLGLSFAGWNVVVALILASLAMRGAFGRAD